MPVITTPACTDHGGTNTPPHFALDFLPAYSPELNPIERVWKLTRRRCLHNRYFDHLQDVIGAVESEFATWTTRNDVLRRLCAIT
jgi:transposase